MRNLACASRRAHGRAQEYVNPNGSISQTVAMGGKLRAVVIRDGLQESDIEATDEHPLACQRDTRRRFAFGDQYKIRAMVRRSVRAIVRLVLRRQCLAFVLDRHRTLLPFRRQLPSYFRSSSQPKLWSV